MPASGASQPSRRTLLGAAVAGAPEGDWAFHLRAYL